MNSLILLFLHSSLAVWTETGTGTVLFRIASWDRFRKRILYIFVWPINETLAFLEQTKSDAKNARGLGRERAVQQRKVVAPSRQKWRNICQRVQPRSFLFSIGVALMCWKVNFHLVRSALQISMCLLRTKLKFERSILIVYQALQALQLFLYLDSTSKWPITNVRYIKIVT